MENITYKEYVRRENLIYTYRAAYENAIDYLYYGYSFKKWFENHNFLDYEDAKIIWSKAIQYLPRD